jgi:hypothetical protein
MIRTPTTVTVLLRWLSTKHNSIDLTKKAFCCKQIEEHKRKQESIGTQSEIADEYDAKMSMGVQALNTKELITTVV